MFIITCFIVEYLSRRGLGSAAAIVREQRRAPRLSGGCGIPSAELFSKCCTKHFMESQGAEEGCVGGLRVIGRFGGRGCTPVPAVQADRAKFISFLY